jgi:hypothetical protein
MLIGMNLSAACRGEVHFMDHGRIISIGEKHPDYRCARLRKDDPVQEASGGIGRFSFGRVL